MDRLVICRPKAFRHGGTYILVLLLALVTMQIFADVPPGAVRALSDGSPQAQAGTIRVVPPSVTVNEGENVTVDVWLENVAGYYGIDFRFSFDQTVVSVPAEQATPLWEVFDSASHWIVKNQADNESGDMWYAVINLNPAEPFTGTGRICSITFSGLAPGTTVLDLYYAKGATKNGEGLYPTQVDGEIVVQAINDPPVANDDAAATDEDTPVGIAVLTNDSDPDGAIDPSTVSIVSGPTHGSVSVNPTGVVTYTPDAGYHGVDSFTYTVNDDDGATSNEATVSVTVGEVNIPPVANDDAIATDEDTPVGIAVLTNDSDPDGAIDPATVSIVSGPTHGSVSVDASGVVTYTPDADYHGADSFTYTVNDDDGATSNEATVSVTVNPAPTISSLSPAWATAGDPGFPLTINGANFVTISIVHWNGGLRTTTVVSSTQIIANITAADIATVGTANVTVVNPTPRGGTSNVMPFEITEMEPEPPSDFVYLPFVVRDKH